MSKRILIYCFVLVAAYVLVESYSWFRARRLNARTRTELDAMLSDEIAQRDALAALGNLNLDPDHFTLAELQDRLHRPSLRQAGTRNTTKLGWACGKDRCAIWASFLVPFGQEIPLTQPAAALIANELGFSPSSSLAVGGINLGEPVEAMQNSCRRHGCVPLEKNRMRWSEDWNFVWSDSGGKIGWLVFLNEKAIQRAGANVGSDLSHLPKESTPQ